MLFVVTSFISMLVWGVVTVSIPITLLIKGIELGENKKWLIISYNGRLHQNRLEHP